MSWRQNPHAQMTAWATPAGHQRSYQSVIQSPAPKSANAPMTPRKSHNVTRGPRATRASRASSHGIGLLSVAQESF